MQVRGGGRGLLQVCDAGAEGEAAGRALLWGLPSQLPFLLLAWLQFPKSHRQGPPRSGAVRGVLMWFTASLNSHSPRIRARDVGLMSFFQLHKYFKGVEDAYKTKNGHNMFHKNNAHILLC